MIELSYVMVKPFFANNKMVIDEVIKRLEKAGLKIKKQGFIKYTTDMAKKHYHEHVEKSFYAELEKYITSDIAYGMEVEGENAIAIIRELIGSTMKIDKQTGKEILPAKGTIRYDIPLLLGQKHNMTQNVVHASDSAHSAVIELEIFKNNAN